MSLPKIYKFSPIWLQNIFIFAQGERIKRTRFGKGFKKELGYFKNNDPSRINYEQIRIFLKEAANTKYWSRKFKEFSIDLNSPDLLKEIDKLPILSKSEVVNNLNDIKNFPAGHIIRPVNTSGTTGGGLIFQQTQEMENKQWAVWWRYRSRFGIKIDDWMAWFGGRSIVPIEQKTKPYWRINYPLKQLMFSAHHLNIHTVKYYYDKLTVSKIAWLHGYPSQLSYFANLIIEKGLPPLSGIKFITTGAENLLEQQIEAIEAAFNCRPIQHYGLAEGVSNISLLPSGKFQIDNDFAFTELIPTEFDNSVYKIIGTNYWNLAFPLIRYDTNDLATVLFRYGQPEIISIDGRNEDFISLPDGVKLGRLDHIFKEATFIKEAQIIQETLNILTLKIVKNKNFDDIVHEKKVVNEFKERVGDKIKIEIKYVDKIERTPSGKLKFVISKI